MFKKLYRNTGQLFQRVEAEIGITGGSQRTITYKSPGWYAVDIYCQAPVEADGSLSKKKVRVTVDGEEKLVLRGSWPWTRHYFFVDEGTHVFKFHDEGMKVVKLKEQWAVRYQLLTYIKAIENYEPVKPLEEYVEIPILGGYTRYQSVSKRGSRHGFTVAIKGTAEYRDFISNLGQVHLLVGDEGLYGGVLLPGDTDVQKKGGDLYLVKCVLHSASIAGVGAHASSIV